MPRATWRPWSQLPTRSSWTAHTSAWNKTLSRNRAFAWFISQYNAVPINQEGFSREGLRTIIDYLKAGRAVVMFPEGERTPNGQMQPLRPGVHLLVKWVEMPIVPIGIAGA